MFLKGKLILLCLLFVLNACSVNKSEVFSLSVSNPVTNKMLSSASAASVKGDTLLVFGDDAPWLFHVDKDYQIKRKVLMKAYPLQVSGRISKKIKPDFEAMSKISYNNKTYYLVLGSGSKPIRSIAYLMDEAGLNQREINLSTFYQRLRQASGFSEKQHLNIEGLAVSEDQVFILNRGNSGTNLIFTLKVSELMNYLFNLSHSLASLKTYFVSLPSIGGAESTFSGVDYWPQRKSLIFSASVETKSDAIRDGEVSGSFIGLLPLSQLHMSTSPSHRQSLVPFTQLLKTGEQVLLTKVESVAIGFSNQQLAKGYLVSDNDDGTSQFMSFEVTVP